jgi:hypothetical protein
MEKSIEWVEPGKQMDKLSSGGPRYLRGTQKILSQGIDHKSSSFGPLSSTLLALQNASLFLFVWLISHGRKYCCLFCCKRKTLLNS